MKKIKNYEVEHYINEAIKNNLKSILFVSITCNTDGVLNWFDNNKEYIRYGYTPQFLYDIVDGNIVHYDNYILLKDWMDDLNNEKAILFVYPFGDQCIYNFEGFMELVKNRKYVNIYPNGYPEISEDRKSIITHPNGKIEHLSCEKLKLFIGITTGTGSFGMDEKYYEDFDEVYLLDN